MAHRRAPQADFDLDDIWYYIATPAGLSSPRQKSPNAGNAGGTACARTADQQFAKQVGQAFSLPPTD